MDCQEIVLVHYAGVTTESSRPAALRRLMAGPGLTPLAGVYDALSAVLAERAGLPVAYMSGYCVAAGRLGLPDVGYLTLTEMVETAARIADRISIPLLADGDDGYGNHLNVARLVRGLERAGVAGVQIEDQVSPKRCGHMAGKRVVPKAEMVAKIKAAADTRQDADFAILARTDAVAVTGYADALDRARAYLEAGADMIFIEALETPEQMAEVPRLFACPTVFNWALGGRSPTPPAAEIAAMGYRFVQNPDVVFAVTRALGDLYAEVRRAGTYAAMADRMSGFAEFNEMIGLEAVAAMDARYRPGGG
ncbi:isocitrate lyase/PEP mutase family protein [Rhodovarius lipocyclicus]|uniref:isocitrate lyase/PEP mutase family protein n=1 Tax=Rhodovarius lipocyclicus TaxID=268410 RepID=UPI00135798EB|nr:oxaloacetate decarboxylase [Rhodovarius lipocyclicus]